MSKVIEVSVEVPNHMDSKLLDSISHAMKEAARDTITDWGEEEDETPEESSSEDREVQLTCALTRTRSELLGLQPLLDRALAANKGIQCCFLQSLSQALAQIRVDISRTLEFD